MLEYAMLIMTMLDNGSHNVSVMPLPDVSGRDCAVAMAKYNETAEPGDWAICTAWVAVEGAPFRIVKREG